MSRPNLAQLLTEATRKAEEERDFNNQIARVTAIVKQKIEAETSKPMSCPNCGEPLPESWRPSESTSGTDNDDVDDNDTEYDDRKLTPLQRALKSKGLNPFAED